MTVATNRIDRLFEDRSRKSGFFYVEEFMGNRL